MRFIGLGLIGALMLLLNLCTLGADPLLCEEGVCPLPDAAQPAAAGLAASLAGPEPSQWGLLDDFETVAQYAGYASEQDFIKFLAATRSTAPQAAALKDWWNQPFTWLTFVIIFLGGLALNLTPCVLPLIPVNLAIIGAGVQSAGRRRQRFWLGLLYGAGMALAYGLVGGIVVAAGLKFGALNASAWFNLGVAAIFLLLALAMFDVYLIDLTRWQGSKLIAGQRGLLVFGMGMLAALLAGACVAPVVLSVILLATKLVAQGNPAGLFLPLILGVGMGLPWPLAGAGLSFLPKSGKWMNYIKYAFGVLILLAAFYYAGLGIRLLMPRPAEPRPEIAQAWLSSIPEGLAQAQAQSRPILIDFWASWCKNCQAMDATTLRATQVQEALNGFIKVKYQAERPNQSPDREVLDHFEIIGLPSYVILQPRLTQEPARLK